MSSKLIATYGSLRKGFHNNMRFGEMEFIGTDSIDGYMTLVYKSYPQLCLNSGGHQSKHVLEIYKVTEDQFASIDNMEIASGYTAITINTDFGEATMWVIEDENNMVGDYIERYSRKLLDRVQQND